MPEPTDIVTKASQFVARLFAEELSDDLPYHTLDHTKMVAETAHEIGEGMKLGDEGIEIVTLAAWLHDTGYTEQYKGHEDVSIRIATEFLEREHYPAEKIALVAGCIAVTKIPQRPKNGLEEIVADADLSGFGRRSFFKQGELLRKEWVIAFGRSYTDLEWAEQNLELLQSHRYFTRYAELLFHDHKAENIGQLSKKIKKLTKMKSKPQQEELDPGSLVEKFPHIEGINFHDEPDTKLMHRRASKRMKEISLADNKAMALLVACTILLATNMSFVTMSTNPSEAIPLVFFLTVVMVAMIYSIRALLPENNIAYTLDDAIDRREIMLSRKNRLVRRGYLVLLYGLIISGILFVILFAFLMHKHSNIQY
jgi:predicted metal-dependent HD superfamily phosphohydrolase